ncbi:MAG: hypothetical protein NZM35_04840 [Chitinophagales bacterium]|nr:hypothetical protein [Chitinophagales bacterium]MDW8419354.1 hypothetical protein [Chitinophagales bacterium]
MYHRYFFTIIIMLCAHLPHAQPGELTREEKQQLKKELREYMKDLEGYRAKMKQLHTTIDSNQAEIKRLKDDIAYCETHQAELESKIAAIDAELKKLQQENKLLKGGYVASDSTNGEVTRKFVLDMTKTPEKGTVYKVQIGLYKKFNINKYFEQPRFIGYEEVEGLNRYIISYFPEEQIAKQFVEDVRKMGIKDAFVSKYIDGVRVYEWSKNPKYAGRKVPQSLQEHLEWEKKEKQRQKKKDAQTN